MANSLESGPNDLRNDLRNDLSNDLRREEELPMLLTCLNFVNTVTGLFLGGVTLCALTFASVVSDQKLFTISNSFKTHIYLCTIGYVLLLAPAANVICSNTSWARSLKYPNRKLVHWVLQVSGSAMALVGGIIRITDVGFFNSTHGIFGFIAMVLTTLTLIGGIVNLFSTTQLTKIFHSVFGCLTITVAFIVIIIGFHEYYRPLFGDGNANLLIICTFLGLTGTISLPIINVVRRFQRSY